MPEVADRTVGAKYYAALVRKGQDVYREVYRFALKAAMQDGYLPGTVPLAGDEKLAAAAQLAEQLFAKARMEGLSTREQDALMDALDALEKANAQQATA